PDGAVVTFDPPTAADIVDGAVGVICNPTSGSGFALGANTVTCTATDAHGNMATSSFKIIVRDTTPPVIAVPTEITAEATGPDGAAVTFAAGAVDKVAGAVVATCDP